MQSVRRSLSIWCSLLKLDAIPNENRFNTFATVFSRFVFAHTLNHNFSTKIVSIGENSLLKSFIIFENLQRSGLTVQTTFINKKFSKVLSNQFAYIFQLNTSTILRMLFQLARSVSRLFSTFENFSLISRQQLPKKFLKTSPRPFLVI